jgi:hypothetical protein
MEPQTCSTRKSELLGYFTFNTSTWDNDGTASLSQQSELLGYFTFNILLVLGIMMEPHNLQHQKSKLLGYFTLLNTSTCTWDRWNRTTLQQEKNCWDFLSSTCTWIMMVPAKLQHKVNCWDFTSTILLVRGIMMEPNLQQQNGTLNCARNLYWDTDGCTSSLNFGILL